MADLTGFNAADIAPQEDFTPLPTGEYRAQITDSEERPTRKGDGSFISLTYDILDGQFKGRKVWARLNLNNPNPKASEIAQRQLSAICHAVGVLQPRKTEDLHYKPHVIRVEYVVADGVKQTKDGNEVKAWKADSGNAPAPTAPASTTTTSPSDNRPAWMSRAA